MANLNVVDDAAFEDGGSPTKKGAAASSKRTSLYIEPSMSTELEMQVRQDKHNTNSWINNLLQVLLTSEGGRNLRSFAREEDRTFLELLRDLTNLLDKKVPLNRISKLADKSQRNIIQMMIYLMLLGLKQYESGTVEPLIDEEKS